MATAPVNLPLDIDVDARIDINSTGENTTPEFTAYIKNGLLNAKQDGISLARRTGYQAIANEALSFTDIVGYVYSDYDKYHLSILKGMSGFDFEIRDVVQTTINYTLDVAEANSFDFTFFGLGTNNRYAVFAASTEFDSGGAWNMWSFDLDNLAVPPIKLTNAGNGIEENKTLARGTVSLDNYIFSMTTEGEIYNSNVGDHLTWGGLDFLVANTAQDKKVYLAQHRDHLLAMGTAAMTFYYNAANPVGSPLAVRKDLTIPIGVLNYKVGGTSNIFDLSVETTVPEGMRFKPDGTRGFILDSAAQTVFEYAMASPWDITTMIYTGNSFDVSGREVTPRDLGFSPDGKFMFIMGDTSDRIDRFEMTTFWDITTAIYYSNGFSVAPQMSIEGGAYVSPDGLNFYAVELTSGISSRVYQYSMTEPNNLGTASYTGKSFVVNGQLNSPVSVFFKPDGLVMYVSGFQSGGAGVRRVAQYNLSTAWDVTTATVVTTTTLGTGSARAIHIGSNGTKMYVGFDNSGVQEYNLTTPWLVSTRVLVGTFNLGTTQVGGVSLSPDGTKIYTCDATSTTIRQHTLSTPFSLSTASLDGTFTGNTSNVSGCNVMDDGHSFYTCNFANGLYYRYEMTTAFDITTMNYFTNTKSVSAQDATPQGFDFSPDGLNFYMIGNTSDAMFQYTTTVPWDMAKLVYATKTLSVATEDIDPKGLFIGNSGNSFYVTGNANDTLFQYDLTTAYDLATASYSSKSKLVASEDSTPVALAFRTDGDLLFMLGSGTQIIYEYGIGTTWDISSAVIANYYHYTNSVGTDGEYVAFIATSSKRTGTPDVELLHDGVYMFENFVLKKISTDAIDTLISLQLQDRGVNKMRVAIHTISGRKVILVGDGTLVYDIQKQRWYIWTWRTETNFDWKFAVGEFLAMGPGNIIKYTTTLLKDQDALFPATYNIYPFEVLAPEITGGTMRQKFCKSLIFDGDYADSANVMQISYSDDGYQTFSNPVEYDFNTNYVITRLGQFKKRAWKFSQTETDAGAGENPLQISSVELGLDVTGTYRG